MEKRFFHFSYPETQKREKPRLHALRDGDAFAELAATLFDQHYHFGELVLNFRHSTKELTSLLAPSDLLVLTTRPPLNDDEFDRRHIARSGTELEKAILDAVGFYFSVCRRSYVKLSQDMAANLKYPNRGEIQFSMYAGGYYKRYRAPYTRNRKLHKWAVPTNARTTAGFVVSTRLWDGGPKLLNVFSFDGASTLIWCYLLRTVYPELLASESRRFVMAEITASPLPDIPSTLSFAKKWKVEILLDHRSR
jgi:hypothetical protein